MDIKEAIHALDPTNDEHWTQEGLPQLEAIRKVRGGVVPTRAEVTDAAPGLVREQIQVPDKDPHLPRPSTDDVSMYSVEAELAGVQKEIDGIQAELSKRQGQLKKLQDQRDALLAAHEAMLPSAYERKRAAIRAVIDQSGKERKARLAISQKVASLNLTPEMLTGKAPIDRQTPKRKEQVRKSVGGGGE